AATSASCSDLVAAARLAAGGRGFFFGGISPATMRSYTRTQRAAFSASLVLNVSAVRSRPPNLPAASWQEWQWVSRNAVGGAALETLGIDNAEMHRMSRNMKLPMACDTVGVEIRIRPHNGKLIYHGLRDDHSIEWIAMA